MNKKILFLILLFPIVGYAQISDKQQTELNALNTYLQFTNESTHGLLIVHRLLESFNQKVNKYVDLESKQLNFYSNADLPADIFEDEEHWFYDVSPNTLYNQALTGGKVLPTGTAAQLRKDMNKIKSQITRVNAIRFELEALTKEEDLKEKKNLAKIYKIMEEIVAIYDDFNVTKKRLKNTIKKRFGALNIANDNKELGNIIAIHENIRAFLEGVRAEDKKNLSALSQHLKNNLATAKSFKVNDRTYQNVLQKATSFSKVAQKYLDGVAFPSEYQLYGNTYYYYNVEMVAKFNRYGSGLVADLNEWITDKKHPALLQLEEPHFFKVIYPKREVPKVEAVSAVEPKVKVPIRPTKLPEKLDDRNVVVKQKKMEVEGKTITIEVYDHQLADGDIISLNYNGHWILENYQLRRRARKMTLPLKPTNDNYLILHAVNLGNKPPNTATLSYIYKGEKKRIVMESDMNESEMIQINIEE